MISKESKERIETRKAWQHMQDQLDAAFKKFNFGPDSLIKIYTDMIKDDKTKNSDRIRLMELVSKWAGLNAPERQEIEVSTKIGVTEPDDLDI